MQGPFQDGGTVKIMAEEAPAVLGGTVQRIAPPGGLQQVPEGRLPHASVNAPRRPDIKGTMLSDYSGGRTWSRTTSKGGAGRTRRRQMPSDANEPPQSTSSAFRDAASNGTSFVSGLDYLFQDSSAFILAAKWVFSFVSGDGIALNAAGRIKMLPCVD